MACVLLAVYAVFIEPRWFAVTSHEVEMQNLPAGGELRIVQAGDFHAGRYVWANQFKRVVDIINAQSPDIVVLTGDFVSKPAESAEDCAREFSRIEAPLGVYAVLGNHDHWTDADVVSGILKKHGVQMLTNKHVEVAPGLVLVGVDDLWAGKPKITKAFKNVPEDSAIVVLSHSPRIVTRIKQRNVVILAAHTHAGQVDIPGIPRNKLPGLLGWKYIRGWYRLENARMYVNRGIGMVTPPVRFRCRPEISVFDLKPAGK